MRYLTRYASTLGQLALVASLAVSALASPPGAHSCVEAPLVALEPQASTRVLLVKDFSADLPEAMQSQPTSRKTATISINDHGSFTVLVHYDRLNDHPNFFRKVEIELPTPVAGVKVAATTGYPVNLGTSQAPVMAVPILLQWSGEGWLRTDQWTLCPDGQLKKSP